MTEAVGRFIAIQDDSYARAGRGLHESYPQHLAMDAATMAAFLRQKVYAVLATGRRDGRPHAAPIAFSVWGGAFWIATVESARLRNLRLRPYASIVIMDGDQRGRHRAVIAEGPVIIHVGRATLESDAAFAQSWRARHGSDPAWAAAMIELRPDRIFSFDGTLETRA